MVGFLIFGASKNSPKRIPKDFKVATETKDLFISTDLVLLVVADNANFQPEQHMQVPS